MLRLEGRDDPQCSFAALAAVLMPAEELGDGCAVYSGGSLYRMDTVWLRSLSVYGGRDGRFAVLGQAFLGKRESGTD